MKTITLLLAMIALLFSISASAMSQKDAACGIWLCLPSGFGEGCGPSYSEFKRRIKKRINPLPSIASCQSDVSLNGILSEESKSAADRYNYRTGVAVYAKVRRECTTWQDGFEGDRYCVAWDMTDCWYEGLHCGDHPWTGGINCTTIGYFVKITQDNIDFGEPAFYYTMPYPYPSDGGQ